MMVFAEKVNKQIRRASESGEEIRRCGGCGGFRGGEKSTEKVQVQEIDVNLNVPKKEHLFFSLSNNEYAQQFTSAYLE